MKNLKIVSLFMALTLLIAGCGMSNTAKGGLIGAGGGAALGALIGRFAGNTVVGAAIGTAVGAGAGTIIGNKMDKAKKAAEKVSNAQVQSITDKNGLQAVKVTFDSGILFSTGKSILSTVAQTSLAQFATVLNSNPDVDIAIYGHTDNTGSAAINETLSMQRAQAVQNYLVSCRVSSSQFKYVQGKSFTEPVASNDTEAGRAQNRRVEVYMYASEAMINAANAAAAAK